MGATVVLGVLQPYGEPGLRWECYNSSLRATPALRVLQPSGKPTVSGSSAHTKHAKQAGSHQARIGNEVCNCGESPLPPLLSQLSLPIAWHVQQLRWLPTYARPACSTVHRTKQLMVQPLMEVNRLCGGAAVSQTRAKLCLSVHVSTR